MATTASPESGSFWASVGAGLFAGLLIVLLVFRMTGRDEPPVNKPSPVTAVRPATTTTKPGAALPATTVAPGKNPAVAKPVQPGAATTVKPATPLPGKPNVAIRRAIGPCKYGPDCLIASFTISGFTEVPRQYICEFQDGTRSPFSFKGDSVDNACSTKTVPGSITIEVLGVRSDKITNP